MKQFLFWLRPWMSMFLKTAGPVLAETAMDVVTHYAGVDGMTGDYKREAAYHDIKSRLKARGIEVSGKLINAAIETALINLQGK